MDERKRLGNRGEEAVAAWLRRQGYCLLASQYRCRFGEIDLVARSREGVLCFVEVKQRRLRITAEYYLSRTGQGECPCRFDVAEVYPALDGEMTINYITNAF